MLAFSATTNTLKTEGSSWEVVLQVTVLFPGEIQSPGADTERAEGRERRREGRERRSASTRLSEEGGKAKSEMNLTFGEGKKEKEREKR